MNNHKISPTWYNDQAGVTSGSFTMGDAQNYDTNINVGCNHYVSGLVSGSPEVEKNPNYDFDESFYDTFFLMQKASPKEYTYINHLTEQPEVTTALYYKNKAVFTSKQICLLIGLDTSCIQYLHTTLSRAKKHFIENEHYFRLTGDDAKIYAKDNDLFVTATIILWTRLGFMEHLCRFRIVTSEMFEWKKKLIGDL